MSLKNYCTSSNWLKKVFFGPKEVNNEALGRVLIVITVAMAFGWRGCLCGAAITVVQREILFLRRLRHAPAACAVCAPAAAADAPPSPFPRASCPRPLASRATCIARSRGRSTSPGPAQPTPARKSCYLLQK